MGQQGAFRSTCAWPTVWFSGRTAQPPKYTEELGGRLALCAARAFTEQPRRGGGGADEAHPRMFLVGAHLCSLLAHSRIHTKVFVVGKSAPTVGAQECSLLAPSRVQRRRMKVFIIGS